MSLDALPYIDPLDEHYEALALSLIEDEMKNLEPRQTKDLEPIHFGTNIFEKEYEERTQRQGPMPQLPSSATLSAKTAQHDIESLRESVRQLRIAFEKERLREATLAAEKRESSSLWKQQIEVLNQQLKVLQQRLDIQQGIVDQINFTRQQEQEGYGRELDRGTMQFQELLRKRVHLKNAIQQLKDEINGCE